MSLLSQTHHKYCGLELQDAEASLELFCLMSRKKGQTLTFLSQLEYRARKHGESKNIGLQLRKPEFTSEGLLSG
jgi:hypothetical protein